MALPTGTSVKNLKPWMETVVFPQTRPMVLSYHPNAALIGRLIQSIYISPKTTDSFLGLSLSLDTFLTRP